VTGVKPYRSETMAIGVLFVVSAPSGAGKSTLIKRISPLFPDMTYSVSCTTRSPRAGEVDGVHYHFVDRDRFMAMTRDGAFLEWKEVHGCLYGTPAAPARKVIDSGGRMIMDIDVQGAKEVFEKVERAVGIFVTAPNVEALEVRLRSRAADSDESIRSRVEEARNEMRQADMFHYRIVNDDLEHAAQELAEIIRRESETEC